MPVSGVQGSIREAAAIMKKTEPWLTDRLTDWQKQVGRVAMYLLHGLDSHKYGGWLSNPPQTHGSREYFWSATSAGKAAQKGRHKVGEIKGKLEPQKDGMMPL